MSDWESTLIDQTESVDNLRRRESFWQYELDTFQPNGLNERDVALFSCVYLINPCYCLHFQRSDPLYLL